MTHCRTVQSVNTKPLWIVDFTYSRVIKMKSDGRNVQNYPCKEWTTALNPAYHLSERSTRTLFLVLFFGEVESERVPRAAHRDTKLTQKSPAQLPSPVSIRKPFCLPQSDGTNQWTSLWQQQRHVLSSLDPHFYSSVCYSRRLFVGYILLLLHRQCYY